MALWAADVFSLAGQVALVTGGGSGIGQAIAVALADAGADVALTVNQSPGDVTREDVMKRGRRCFVKQIDLSAISHNGAASLADEVQSELGRVTILVNSAGVIRRSDATTYTIDDWRTVLDLNLETTWVLCQTFGRSMVAHEYGKIINVASLLSFQGGVFVPAYSASKHAVVGITRALANEWAAVGVNVNAIAPGYIATAATKALRADPERSQQILLRIPAGRWGRPEDVGGAAVFLASGAASYVHGHVLVVDGGWMSR